MPVSRFILIVASVILAAGLSIWLGFGITQWVDPAPGSGTAFTLALMVGYLAWRRFGTR